MQTQQFIYRNNERPLHIDVFRPEQATDPLPGIVFFFGGGWVNGHRQQFVPFARHLAERGMLAAVADYRIRSIDQTDPTCCVMDGKSVMRFMRQHADEMGLDPTRLAAGGGSAGAHVAAATACVDRWDHPDDDSSISPRPAALALFNPVINNGPGQWGHDRVGDYYQDISPFHRVHNQWPDTCIMLGAEDQLISVATMQEFAENIRSRGAQCVEHYYAGQPHGFFNYKEEGNPYFEKTRGALDEFMVQIGYLS